MKNRPVRAHLFREDGRTDGRRDRHAEAKVAFRLYAKVLKNCSHHICSLGVFVFDGLSISDCT